VGGRLLAAAGKATVNELDSMVKGAASGKTTDKSKK
jgi:hypothetical protein